MFSGSFTKTSSFISHWLNSVDEHSLQAPSVYEFYTEVVKDNYTCSSLEKVKQLRRSLLADHTILEVTDHGTGGSGSNLRAVSTLTRSSNKPKVSRLLYNICRKTRPAVILELGTSLGISTLCMAAAAPEARIITIEGCSEIGAKALEHFRICGASGISLINGDIDQVIAKTLSKLSSIDLLFIDANHRYRPTLDYFQQCLPLCHPQTTVVIDDIYWSSEMTRAWCEIKKLGSVKMTLDLFHAGVVLFREGIGKKHYILKL